MAYTTANTTNMMHHLQRRHSEVLLSPSAKPSKLPKGQTTLKEAFSPPLLPSSQRAKEITMKIGRFIAKGLKPFSVVEEEGFRELLQTLEPKYNMPSRIHFSKSLVPALYEDARTRGVKESLKTAEAVALTTDGGTSRATQSYITITAHLINSMVC